MKKFSRRKMALALACASIFGGKTQAMKEPQSRQNVVAVGRATDKNSNKRFANRAKDHKWQLAVGGTLTAAAAVTLTILGVKYWGKKDNDGEPNKKPNINNPDVNNEIKVEPEEESIIEKNIAKIKRESDKNIANETFELFFDKVKIILDNKDKLVDGMNMDNSMGEDFFKLREVLMEKDWKDAWCETRRHLKVIIKEIVDDIIETLYNKEIFAHSSLEDYKWHLKLWLGDNKPSISISKDGRKFWLSNDNYLIEFDDKLDIGEF
ncbi:MAG: hypothetical protein IJQ10_03040 [Clostridia bacterium]|nr:hypothetical protein [Clostridia bacterium]